MLFIGFHLYKVQPPIICSISLISIFFDMNITTTIFDRYEHTPMIWQPSTVSISIVGHPASRGPGLAATQNGPAGGAARPSGARLTSDEG